jgi:hypothetical protein
MFHVLGAQRMMEEVASSGSRTPYLGAVLPTCKLILLDSTPNASNDCLSSIAARLRSPSVVGWPASGHNGFSMRPFDSRSA